MEGRADDEGEGDMMADMGGMTGNVALDLTRGLGTLLLLSAAVEDLTILKGLVGPIGNLDPRVDGEVSIVSRRGCLV